MLLFHCTIHVDHCVGLRAYPRNFYDSQSTMFIFTHFSFYLSPHPGPSTGGASATTSSAAFLEELDLQARELYYLGTIPSPIYERDPEYYRSLAKTLAERSESPLFGDHPPPSYESLSDMPTFSLRYWKIHVLPW